jgi:hypothetical protein
MVASGRLWLSVVANGRPKYVNGRPRSSAVVQGRQCKSVIFYISLCIVWPYAFETRNQKPEMRNKLTKHGKRQMAKGEKL